MFFFFIEIPKCSFLRSFLQTWDIFDYVLQLLIRFLNFIIWLVTVRSYCLKRSFATVMFDIKSNNILGKLIFSAISTGYILDLVFNWLIS